MPRIIKEFHDDLIATIQSSGVAVLRTDTLYGIVCSANDKAAVNRVYQIKQRNEAKSPITLVADQSQLYDTPDDTVQASLEMMWPGPYSIILPSERAPYWVTRDNHSVAYRIPHDDALRYLLRQTGPLIAPSANPEGESPALTIQQAVQYFGESVDIYVDGGEVTDARPSTLLRFNGNMFERLR